MPDTVFCIFAPSSFRMYYLIFGLLYTLSLLPLRVLYLFSDLGYFLLYPVFGYRRKIVLGNLKIAFPEKTDLERRAIARKFYRNFVDNFIETLKLLSCSRSFIKRHFDGDMIAFQQIYEQGLRCQIHLGHNFNWEVANLGIPLYIKYELLVVYMPIGNRYFNRLFLYLRGRTGNHLLPATEMRKAMFAHRDKQYCLALVADQVPGDVKKAYWLNFFGKATPFIPGPEKGARSGNVPVIFVHFTKSRRGHYVLHSKLIENPAALAEGELTRMYVRYLEEVLRKNPEMWLWSHRRWKREWKDEYSKLWIDETPAPVKHVSAGL